MQAIMETIFDIAYLTTVILLGIGMIRGGNGCKTVKQFGWMAVILGCGDAFHLVPRAYALSTDGLDQYVAALGFGTFITSITMTVFYVTLYLIGKRRYALNNKALDCLVYGLAFLRIVLCFMPQNQWMSPDAPTSWGIYRNLPFAALGLFMIVLFYQKATLSQDSVFQHMWIAISLSFAFYIPVVLWADTYPIVGVLMIPKTCAYVWIVIMGWNMMKKEKGN